MNWWISAGAFDGFAPEEIRISWQIVARSWWLDGWHSWKPKAAILTTTKAWSQSETFGFWFSHDPSKVCPRFAAKSLTVLFSCGPQGHRNLCIDTNCDDYGDFNSRTLSGDWSDLGPGLRNWPNFLRYFQSVAQSGLGGPDRSSRGRIKELRRYPTLPTGNQWWW